MGLEWSGGARRFTGFTIGPVAPGGRAQRRTLDEALELLPAALSDVVTVTVRHLGAEGTTTSFMEAQRGPDGEWRFTPWQEHTDNPEEISR